MLILKERWNFVLLFGHTFQIQRGPSYPTIRTLLTVTTEGGSWSGNVIIYGVLSRHFVRRGSVYLLRLGPLRSTNGVSD